MQILIRTIRNTIKNSVSHDTIIMMQDMDLKENLATHDAAIKKYKDFKPKVPLQARYVLTCTLGILLFT